MLQLSALSNHLYCITLYYIGYESIMNNYRNSYGVKNVVGGVEFYFELDLAD